LHFFFRVVGVVGVVGVGPVCVVTGGTGANPVSAADGPPVCSDPERVPVAVGANVTTIVQLSFASDGPPDMLAGQSWLTTVKSPVAEMTGARESW